ncbi:MAG: hypothetical protein U1E73_00105 [Planctomycetota bacterium]
MRLGVFALHSLLAAQAPGPAVPHEPPGAGVALPKFDRVLFDRPAEGELWAIARSYKMSFTADVATFVPRFAPTAPRDFPIAFRLDRIAIAGQALPIARDRTPNAAGTRVTIARGAVTEIYDLTPDGVEQSFELAAAPPPGDLLLRLAVTTELVVHAVADGLQFTGAEGVVDYRRAVAIDAAGRRTPLAVHGDGDAIELAVPAAVMAAATWPLVIDPLISTNTVINTGTQEIDTDLAFDAETDQGLLVFEQVFSVSDHDIYSLRVDHDGAPIANTMTAIDATQVSCVRPRVARHHDGDRFLVVATQLGAPTATDQVFGRTRDATTNQTSPYLSIRASSSANARFPDVGGDQSTSSHLPYLVVWQEIDANQTITVVGATVANGLASAPFTIGATIGGSSVPAVASSLGADGPNQGWPVVWDSMLWTHWIIGAVIGPAGNTMVPAGIWFASQHQMISPVVSSFGEPDGADRRCMVTWYEDTGVGTTNNDVFAGVRSLLNGTVVPETDVSTLLGLGDEETLPKVATVGDRFVLTLQQLPLLFPWDVLATTLEVQQGQAAATLAVVEPAVHVTSSTHTSPDHYHPVICSAYAGGASTFEPRCLIGWIAADDVFDAAYEALFGQPLDPRATFLRANNDAEQPPLVIPLASLGATAGQWLEVRSIGALSPAPTWADAYRSFVGVFSSSNVVLPSTQQHRVPGALAAGPAYVSLPTFSGSLPTDIAEDFFFSNTGHTDRVVVRIPVGANHLVVGVYDSFYGDNTDPNGDLHVLARVVPAPQFAGTGEAIELATGVNGPATSTPEVKSAPAGSTVRVEVTQPIGLLGSSLWVIAGRLAPASQTLTLSLPGVWVGLGSAVLASGITTTQPTWAGVWTFTVPSGLQGLSMPVQAAVLAPSLARNNLYASSNAHRLVF